MTQQDTIPVYDSSRRRWTPFEEICQIWNYRDLLHQLVMRNIRVRYKRSFLGVVWTMLNPLLMMTVLTFIFSESFRFSVSQYPAYALAGLTAWNFFTQTTSGAMSELVWGGNLLHRIYIPRSIFAMTALGTSLVNLLLALPPLLLILFVTGVPIGWSLALLPLSMLILAIFSLGVALFLSRLAAAFTDVMEMYQVFLTLWMYCTPIIYPVEIVPERYRWLMRLNPVWHLVETFRAPLHSGHPANARTLAISIACALAAFIIGWWFFARKADELAYRI